MRQIVIWVPAGRRKGRLSYSNHLGGILVGNSKTGHLEGFSAKIAEAFFLRRAGEDFGRPGRRNVDVAGSRTASEGESNGGFVEFGDVDFGVGGLDGIWHTGGLWNPSRGVCADAPAAEAGGGEDATGSGAGVVKRLVVSSQFLLASLSRGGWNRLAAGWERLQMVISGHLCGLLSTAYQLPIPEN